ncbi:hypothetical protein MVEG_02528 [Podila verticillata NRRL 6337]|nr:hypothetical protein MVEG_02528 [Podila verticillata NRRL 6337]
MLLHAAFLETVHIDTNDKFKAHVYAKAVESCRRARNLSYIIDGLMARISEVLLGQSSQEEEEEEKDEQKDEGGIPDTASGGSSDYESRSSIYKYPRILVSYPPLGRDLYAKIAEGIWTEKCDTLVNVEEDSTVLEKAVLDKVFERVFNMLHMRMVTLEDFSFVNIASSRLAHYRVPIAEFTPEFCSALLVHAASLKTVHIECSHMSQENLRTAVGHLVNMLEPQVLCLQRDRLAWPAAS